jgi:hypothetical protein
MWLPRAFAVRRFAPIALLISVILFNELALGNLLEHFALGYVVLEFMVLPGWLVFWTGSSLATQWRNPAATCAPSLAALARASGYVPGVFLSPTPWLLVPDPTWRTVTGWAGIGISALGCTVAVARDRSHG